MSERARTSELDATETVIRAMGTFESGNVDRVLIITLDKNGEVLGFFTNARSEPEMSGMLWEALEYKGDLVEDEEDEDKP